MNRNLQSMIQVFVQIVSQGIGRQEKHRNFVHVVFQPGRSKFAVMGFRIVQNQEHRPGEKSCVSEIRQSQEEERWNGTGGGLNPLAPGDPGVRGHSTARNQPAARSENMISSWLSTRSQF